jgi:hypothetical protein
VTARHEVTAAVCLAVAGGVVLLVAEPVVGLVVLAGAGAAALLQPARRQVLAAVVLALGLGVLVLGWVRSDPLLGIGAALAVAAAAVTTARARRWPAPRREPASGPHREPSARDTWDALDRGEDPTR